MRPRHSRCSWLKLIVAALKGEKVPYQLEDGGRAVLVRDPTTGEDRFARVKVGED